ncbi:family 31 glycoside hydrolase [Immersiella caudata]|uniref:Family 31 glycoside hydrolase n=1 Tax=Immersiella caudata TaxID=314043 RepID=A0AA40C088_9PEZI|nr:family 31 glycoside hydrolase [Immersiella caudata]
MPEYGLGFWQYKLRYQTQDELLQVAREHKHRSLPVEVLPDPDSMIAEIRSLGIKLMVSIWPTVDARSKNHSQMLASGLLIRQDRGLRVSMGPRICNHFDVTNPAARRFVWDTAKRNYDDKGVRLFWLDEAEPEHSVYDFDIYRYHQRPEPHGFYEGMKSAGQDPVVNFVRCAWVGNQKYGILLWSGDVASSWSSFRNQLSAGLSAGIAGISYNSDDVAFRELFVRWFQWGAFCPVFRLHGDRLPQQQMLGHSGGSHCLSGAPNELWSYGEEVYEICKMYLFLREKMRDYVREVLHVAHRHGDPVIRPLFYGLPEDERAWNVTDQSLFGRKVSRCAYSCGGAEEEEQERVGKVLEGGDTTTVDAPLEYMPVFELTEVTS